MSDSSNTTSGDWWDSISVYESDYVPDSFSPGSYVKANHMLLAGMRENDFDSTDSDYTYGLLTLVVVFLAVGILASNLLPCLYTYLSKSYGERLAERLTIGDKSFSKGNVLSLVAGIAAVATVAGTVWGLEKADSGLTTIEDNTQDIANDLRAVLNLPNDTFDALEAVSTSYESLLNNVDACTRSYSASFYNVSNATREALSSIDIDLSSIDIDLFMHKVQAEVETLSTDTLDDLADKVQGVSEAVEATKGIRKGLVWPLISFTIAMIIFLVIALGIYNIFACSVNSCVTIAKFITPCSIILALIVLLSAAAAISMSALSGDFCIDPDSNVKVLLGDNDEATLTDIASYYTGNCSTENVVVNGIIAAQEISVPTIISTMAALYELVEVCEDLSPFVLDVDSALQDLWTVLEDAGELSSCENINGQYQEAVYDELCTKLLEGMLGFWVSCVILTVLLLVLAVQWNRTLRARRTVAQAPAIEAEQQHEHQHLDIFARSWPSRLPSNWQTDAREDPSTQDISPAPQYVELSTPQRLELGSNVTTEENVIVVQTNPAA